MACSLALALVSEPQTLVREGRSKADTTEDATFDRNEVHGARTQEKDDTRR